MRSSKMGDERRGGLVDDTKEAGLAGVKVMVIDDSKTIRRTAETLLRKEGCEVVTAVDGFEALAKITSARVDWLRTATYWVKPKPRWGDRACDHVTPTQVSETSWVRSAPPATSSAPGEPPRW